jgi:small subunit ribosomal protein S8e
MPEWQGKSKRMKTGGRRKLARKKQKFEIGGEKHPTNIGPKDHKQMRTRANNKKIKVVASPTACVTDQKTKKARIVKIKNVLENPANIHYVRRNIITKGAIIETEIGKAKVTSRPGQDGCINAILLE